MKTVIIKLTFIIGILIVVTSCKKDVNTTPMVNLNNLVSGGVVMSPLLADTTDRGAIEGYFDGQFIYADAVMGSDSIYNGLWRNNQDNFTLEMTRSTETGEYAWTLVFQNLHIDSIHPPVTYTYNGNTGNADATTFGFMKTNLSTLVLWNYQLEADSGSITFLDKTDDVLKGIFNGKIVGYGFDPNTLDFLGPDTAYVTDGKFNIKINRYL